MTNDTAVREGADQIPPAQPRYISADLQVNWQPFSGAIQTLLSVSEEAVDKAMDGKNQMSCGGKDGGK